MSRSPSPSRSLPGLLGFAALCLGIPAAVAEDAPIEDNSFLVEEAYNQEAGVVQHISTFMRSRESGDWSSSFTQEWPLGDERHQFSYSLSFLEIGPERGLGDSALNYRIRLFADSERRAALAPRLSILLPTGDEGTGLGSGAFGVQVNMPYSTLVHERLVTHANIGATHLRDVEDTSGGSSNLNTWHAGGSLVWLAGSRINGLLEVVYSTGDEESFLVNPGVRWAYDLESGLQIVPGVSVPIGVGPSSGERAFFLYLSFEHPF